MQHVSGPDASNRFVLEIRGGAPNTRSIKRKYHAYVNNILFRTYNFRELIYCYLSSCCYALRRLQMTLKFFKPCILAVLASAMTLPTMYGNIVTPGNTVSPDTFNQSGLTLINTISGTISPGTFVATYTENVYRVTGPLTAGPTQNGLCLNCLDFEISVTNAGPDGVERVTASNFAGFNTDVGTAIGSTGVAPASVDRSPLTVGGGGVIGFNFIGNGVGVGQSTDTLEIETNAINYIPGLVSIQDGSAGTGAGFEPTATPEPGYMALVGAGLVAVSFFRRKKLS